jgi:hypothetical protein
MINRITLLLFIGLAFWGCEEEQDTTPPTVTITSHESGQSVSEIITITATSEDDDGVSKVEFYLNTTLTEIDTITPYEYLLNTTDYDNGQSLTIKVISYDNSGNFSDHQIVLTVDNSMAVPQGGNIISVTYDLESMTVAWEESPDGDFKNYKVLYSTTEGGDKDTVATYTDKMITSHNITDFDPLVENWFWVQVTDTLGLSSIGIGMTNSLDSEPNPVNVTSVMYDLESMTITWEDYVPNLSRINQMNQNTRSTVTNDFVSYELLQSDSEDGTYTSVIVITEQSTTSHSLIEYNPTQENWFKVKVIDFWNLTSTGTEMTNELDSPPTQVDISSVTYDLTEMIITWEQSSDNDFFSYELLYSETQSGEQTSITTITDINTTSYSISDFDPSQERWYWIMGTDYWGLTNMSDGYYVLDSSPTPSELYPIIYEDGSFFVSWSQNNDEDFSSYKLYESASEDMNNQNLVYETNVRTETTYTVTNIGDNETRYYQIIVEDLWGLRSISNIKFGNTFLFVKTFGGNNNDYGESVQQTTDGGYIIVGYTSSFGNGNNDVWLIKTDFNGNEEWNKTFGESNNDYGRSVQQTTDGGYIITGYTESNISMSLDVLLIKTDSNGNEEWNQIYGGNGTDRGRSVQQTTDGGYIITGITYYGSMVYLIKTDPNGNEEWSKTFGGSSTSWGHSVQQTTDGGYIIIGNRYYGFFNGMEIWLIKTDSQGNMEWEKYWSGTTNDYGYSIQQSTDGGFIFTGSKGGGTTSLWLIKTDSQGNEEWNQIFGGSDIDSGYSVHQTTDGGYIITGYTESFGNGSKDVWLIKTDFNGNEEWNKTFGGSEDDAGYSVQQTTDGGFIITGGTESFGNGESDMWLIKTDSEGNTVPYGD